MLLLQYVPGKSLDHEQEAFLPPNLSSACKALGKLFTLDSGCWCGMCVLIFHLVVSWSFVLPSEWHDIVRFPRKTDDPSVRFFMCVAGPPTRICCWETQIGCPFSHWAGVAIQPIPFGPMDVAFPSTPRWLEGLQSCWSGTWIRRPRKGFRMLQRWSKMGTHQKWLLKWLIHSSQTCSDYRLGAPDSERQSHVFLLAESPSQLLCHLLIPTYPILYQSIHPKITLPRIYCCYISLINSNNILGYPNIYNHIS